LEVVAGKSEPLNFLLDSGAGASAIDLQTTRSLGVQLGNRQNVQGVSGKSFAYRMNDDGCSRGADLPGEAWLLGNALLSKFRLTIDEPRSRVIFEKVR
jgi:hypothetical protein